MPGRSPLAGECRAITVYNGMCPAGAGYREDTKGLGDHNTGRVAAAARPSEVSTMQTLWTVVVLLALVALGALFIARVNAQGVGRMQTHRYADWKQSVRQRMHKRPHDEAGSEAPAAGPPPPSGKAGSDL